MGRLKASVGVAIATTKASSWRFWGIRLIRLPTPAHSWQWLFATLLEEPLPEFRRVVGRHPGHMADPGVHGEIRRAAGSSDGLDRLARGAERHDVIRVAVERPDRHRAQCRARDIRVVRASFIGVVELFIVLVVVGVWLAVLRGITSETPLGGFFDIWITLPLTAFLVAYLAWWGARKLGLVGEAIGPLHDDRAHSNFTGHQAPFWPRFGLLDEWNVLTRYEPLLITALGLFLLGFPFETTVDAAKTSLSEVAVLKNATTERIDRLMSSDRGRLVAADRSAFWEVLSLETRPVVQDFEFAEHAAAIDGMLAAIQTQRDRGTVATGLNPTVDALFKARGAQVWADAKLAELRRVNRVLDSVFEDRAEDASMPEGLPKRVSKPDEPDKRQHQPGPDPSTRHAGASDENAEPHQDSEHERLSPDGPSGETKGPEQSRSHHNSEAKSEPAPDQQPRHDQKRPAKQDGDAKTESEFEEQAFQYRTKHGEPSSVEYREMKTTRAARRCVKLAVGEVFDRDAVVSLLTICESALRFGMGKVTPEEVTAAIYQHPGIVLRFLDNVPYLTTSEALDEEIQAIKFIQAGQNDCKRLGPKVVASRGTIGLREWDKKLLSELMASTGPGRSPQ